MSATTVTSADVTITSPIAENVEVPSTAPKEFDPRPIIEGTEQQQSRIAMSDRRFIVTLQAPPWASDAAGIRQLRRLLKKLGRGYGLRCVAVRPATPEPVPNPDGEYSYAFPEAATNHA